MHSLIETAVTMAKNVQVLNRICAISDIHVDYKQNLEFIENLSEDEYVNDGLILAGDVTDDMTLLRTVLELLNSKFRTVFFVPGNHELWVRNEAKTKYRDSIEKFDAIISLCKEIGVKTRPSKCQIAGGDAVWVVPLFAWYAKPEDDEDDSLHVKPTSRVENVKFMEQVWMDNVHCRWDVNLPAGMTPSKYFATLNEPSLSATHDDAPVISFSHFVPNVDLIRSTPADSAEVAKERERLGLGEAPPFQGSFQSFNFTRYAGSRVLQTQIDRLKPVIHVYGHQHRNRDRDVNGVRYVSHCLGTVREQKDGWSWGIVDWHGPKPIWPPPVGDKLVG